MRFLKTDLTNIFYLIPDDDKHEVPIGTVNVDKQDITVHESMTILSFDDMLDCVIFMGPNKSRRKRMLI